MSLITPLILMVLFVTFLKRVYETNLVGMIGGMEITASALNGFTGSWLISSILGVSCITVAFCSNIIMVEDRINGSVSDLLVAPVKRNILALSYYVANFFTTLIVVFTALTVGLIYLGVVGWYLSAADVLYVVLDVILYTLFGTALTAVVEHFISTRGGISAVATLVSSMYGFLCGAYMPVSQFSQGIRNFVSMLPGTYGVVLLRKHLMGGVVDSLSGSMPREALDGIRSGFDMDFTFFGHQVQSWHMVLVVAGATVLLMAVYILLNALQNKRKE